LQNFGSESSKATRRQVVANDQEFRKSEMMPESPYQGGCYGDENEQYSLSLRRLFQE